jgi:anti-sigma factor RsiW
MTPEQEHSLLWNDRLQDWLDGSVEPEDGEAFESHLAGCEICQQHVAEFELLDGALRRAAPPIALTESFDRRLFEQIDTIDEVQRAAARRRVEQELRENMRALSRSWRRTLAFVIPGVVAGIALALALTGSFLSSDVTQTLVDNAESLSRGNSGLIDVVLISVLGASIGAVIARWLATVAE